MKTDDYIKKIIEETGLPKNEIEKLVNDKKEELKGLISDEGALFVIAKELGVDIQQQTNDILNDLEINISDISPNMRNITLVGRVKEIYRIFNFNKKDGSEGKVGSFLLHDKTGDIRVVLWNEMAEIIQKNQEFDLNELVKIVNGYAKKGKFGNEIHLNQFGKIIISPKDVDYKNYPKIKTEIKEIEEIILSLRSVHIKGKVIRKTPLNTFERKDGTEGKVSSLYLMDKSGSIRITFWNEDTKKLKEIEIGDVLKISNLNPRKSNFDSNKIELFANFNTKIKKIKESIDISAEIVSDIKDLQERNDLVSFKGVITSIDNIKKVKLRSGEEVSLLGFVISDNTDGIRVTLWRELAEKYSDTLQTGQGVYLKNVLIRYSNFSKRKEVSFIQSSELELIDLNIEEPKEIEQINNLRSNIFSGNYKKIKNIDVSQIYEVKGVIVKEINNITVYEACSKCYKKIDNCTCSEPGKSEKRMITNIIIDDGTETMRITFIGDQAERLINEKTELVSEIITTPDYDKFLKRISKRLIGKDIIVRGKAKFSDYSNDYEIVAYNFKMMDVNEELDNIIEEMEV